MRISRMISCETQRILNHNHLQGREKDLFGYYVCLCVSVSIYHHYMGQMRKKGKKVRDGSMEGS